jgi:hypothetical protein
MGLLRDAKDRRPSRITPGAPKTKPKKPEDSQGGAGFVQLR